MIKETLSTAKTKIQVTSWNVRTIYATRKLAQFTEMKRYDLGILGICESRWTGSGRIVTTSG